MKLTRIVAYIALLLATFGLGWHFRKSHVSEVHAQNAPKVTIPKAWGTLKATTISPRGNGTAYVFEAPDGTIRVVSMNSGTVEATASRN